MIPNLHDLGLYGTIDDLNGSLAARETMSADLILMKTQSHPKPCVNFGAAQYYCYDLLAAGIDDDLDLELLSKARYGKGTGHSLG